MNLCDVIGHEWEHRPIEKGDYFEERMCTRCKRYEERPLPDGEWELLPLTTNYNRFGQYKPHPEMEMVDDSED